MRKIADRPDWYTKRNARNNPMGRSVYLEVLHIMIMPSIMEKKQPSHAFIEKDIYACEKKGKKQ
jgi:hypothetical protein